METEVVAVPTTLLRNIVQEKVSAFYADLFQYKEIVLIVVVTIIVFLLIFFIRNLILQKIAKENLPESTNKWFSWEDYKKWLKEQKEE